MTKIAVVTGGCGFIGSHMVDRLVDEGFEVRIIDSLVGGRLENIEHHASNPKVIFENKDIRELKDNASIFKDVDFVYHFAGIGDIVPSIEHPRDYMSVNVQGTVSVLECARYASVKKFVYAASSSCYGLADTPTREDHPIQTQYPYALSKYFGEKTCFHWHSTYGLPVNSIRIFNAYGTRSRTSGAYGAVFGVFLKQKIENKPFTVVGDGNQSRDFVYVTDIVDAFYRASQTNISGEVFNVGAGDPKKINKLVELLGGAVQYVPKRPGEPDCTWANIDKISSQLGWGQTISFEEGVQKMLEQIHYWKNAPLWDEDSIEEATRTWFNCLAQ